MSNDTITFADTFQLGEGWEKDPVTSVTNFIERANRASRFIKKVSDDKNVKLVNIVYHVEVIIAEPDALVDEQVEVSKDESLDENFWIKVANGAKYE